MDIRRLVVAVALLTHPVGADARTVDGGIVNPVIVRVYRQSVGSEAFSAARAQAERLLRAAGIQVRWLQCWSDPRAVIPAPPDCQRPLDPTDVILHVVPAGDTNAAGHKGSLGFALIDPHAPTAHVATVYSDRVVALARNANVDGVDVLGRAIAHEIGHVLMRTAQHPRNGLMRGLWTAAELRRNRPADWLFSKAESRRMRAVVGPDRNSSGGLSASAVRIGTQWDHDVSGDAGE